jgi:hypothetical protein
MIERVISGGQTGADRQTGPCNSCGRLGRLRARETMLPMPSLGIDEPWEWSYYLCCYHQAAETKRRRRIFGSSG